MNVLYVSKALAVASYRAKLDALSRHVSVRAVVPRRWGRNGVEPIEADGPPLEAWPAVLHGHNHLHVYRNARRMLDDRRVDLVHVDEEPYSAAAFQLVRLCRRRGVPSLFFAWQNLDKRLPPPFGALRRRVFRSAAGAIAGTERAAEVLRLGGYGGPIAVIPQFGVDPERFRPNAAARDRVRRELGAAGSDVVVGYAGRLVREKGVALLLDAAAALPAVRLLYVGTGPERRTLERRARALGLASRVRFVGHRASPEMPDWLAACDIVALPSVGTRGWVEQFGRVLVEAMSCGAAVVGSRSGEIPRVVGDAGVLVPPGDAPALAAALGTLAADPARRAELGRCARARVLAELTHERIADRTVRFYREIVG